MKTPRTIGPGWSSDPKERMREIKAQERLVSEIAEIIEEFGDDELESAANEES